ncbi:4-alpha-glucanotransferase, partial [Propionibacterium freudenreichii]|nr:4-alpha-glucanotransferase [Propionibacterium freudenreichii]
VARAGAVPYVNLHVRDGRPARLVVRLEDGGQRDANQVDNWEPPRNIDGQMIGEATFQLPGDLPLGYHRLILDSDDRHAEATLIITPPHLAWPERMKNSRVWGYAAQLYSVRSRQSWGVGDFADLAALSAWSAAEQQADYVLINPVHAAESIPPMEPSPYLPTSRLFVNPIYVRPETVVEYTDLDDSDRARVGALLSSLRGELVGDDQIQRDKCWDHKRRALKIIWSAGRSDDRQMRFDAFRHHQGRMLRDFATWAVLCEHLGGDWRTWEPRFRHPDSPDVGAFRQAHLAEVDFHEWLQWVAAQAQSDAQETATDAGMAMGVITDLAVGVGQSSADVWMMQDLYAPGMTVGAPPDAYNQLGQGWGQPPCRPDRLEASAYAPFRTMVRNALGHAGGVRIDHIIGLFRLWWVPEGMGPAQGTYVRYDHEAMVGILALEAQRAGAVVIGEDLGTVEAWTRGYLAERGILGTSVLWFEEDDQGNPVPAEQWRALTMASVNTHDLPPTAGYLTKAHVALR